jgi:hypothetical protein
MPTFKQGDQIKVVAPKEFTDKVRAEHDKYILDSELAKMKFNLSSRETKELFAQWNQIKQETWQRLQRIEQLSQRQEKMNKEQQLRHHQQQLQQEQQHKQNLTTESNSANTQKDVIIKNLNMMKRVVSGSSGND